MIQHHWKEGMRVRVPAVEEEGGDSEACQTTFSPKAVRAMLRQNWMTEGAYGTKSDSIAWAMELTAHISGNTEVSFLRACART